MSATPREVTVSVIVPTTACAARRVLIRRAIDSILLQGGVRAIPIVLVNGPARDPAMTRELMADPRLRVYVREPAGLAGALQAGRRLVDTAWFAELDDDDELLPGALAMRIEALERCDDLDCVVTNGFRRADGMDMLNIPDMRVVERDPVRTFWDRNWLLPGSYLCRTDRVGADLFDGMPDARECSYVALRLATSYRIRFLQAPTVIWNADTPGSLSKSREMILSGARAHEQLLTLDLPPHARRMVVERITWDYHATSDLYFREGDRRKAWRWHLRSLFRRGGHRFLPFSGTLLRAALGSRSIAP